jgi:hypothetical protein
MDGLLFKILNYISLKPKPPVTQESALGNKEAKS